MNRGPIPDKPKERPTVPDLIELIKAFYKIPGNSTGGNLHIVLEDYNESDSNIEWCINRAKLDDDWAAVVIGDFLLEMTRTQRRKAIRSIR